MVWLLAIGIALDVAEIALDIRFLQLYRHVGAEEVVDTGDLFVPGNNYVLVGLLQIVIGFSVTFAYLAWFYRAYSNILALGARAPRYGRGWSVGAWFVPILDFFRPKQIANDIWRASDPDLPADAGEGWKGKAVAPLLHWWWALWLIGWAASVIADRLFARAETVEEYRVFSFADIPATLLFIAATVLAILVVRAITDRQRTRAAHLTALPASERATSESWYPPISE